MVAACALTAVNLRGLSAGKWVQDVFTLAKIGALLALVALGLAHWGNVPGAALATEAFWTVPAAGPGSLALIVATAMVGALFSADAWNNVGFAAEEMRRPERNLPLSMALGVGLAIGLGCKDLAGRYVTQLLDSFKPNRR